MLLSKTKQNHSSIVEHILLMNHSSVSLKEDYSELLEVCDASEIYLEAFFMEQLAALCYSFLCSLVQNVCIQLHHSLCHAVRLRAVSGL